MNNNLKPHKILLLDGFHINIKFKFNKLNREYRSICIYYFMGETYFLKYIKQIIKK